MTALRATAALALVAAGTYLGLTGNPLSGSTLAGIALIGVGGAWGVVLYARKVAR